MSGCEKFLDKQPIATVTSVGFYNTKENTTLAVNAIYDVWTWERWGDLLYAQGDCGSDDAEVGGNPTIVDDQADAQYIMLYKSLSNNTYVTKFAKLCYTGIQRANNVLQGTDPSNNKLTFDPSKLRGEASFLRAQFYYYLATTIGPVPLILEPLNSDQFTTGNREAGDNEKGTKQLESIYTQIVKDLEYAASVLPAKSATSPGRATKAAAYGYLIKTYATMATSKYIFADKAKTDYWNKVVEYSDKIRTEDPRILEPDYHRLYTVNGENSSESLFEIQFIAAGNYGPQGEGNEAPINFGPRGLFDWVSNYGYGLNSPTVELVKIFDINNGTATPIKWQDQWIIKPVFPLDSNSGAKKEAFLKIQMKKYAPDLLKSYVDYDPRLDLIAKPGDSLYNIDKNKYYKIRAFKGSNDGLFSATGFWDMKTCSALIDGGNQANQLNKILLRYADVLLIEAEAKLALGDAAKATDLVNQIRKRAQDSRYVADPTVGTNSYHPGFAIKAGTTPKLADPSSVTLQDIQLERRKELFLEGVRFYDLVRWDLANATLGNRPMEFHQRSYSWKNDQTIFVPIPSIMISDGKGSVIQNPGY